MTLPKVAVIFFLTLSPLFVHHYDQSGWNPINDIESVIVSIRSLLVVGKGRLESALRLSPQDYQARCAKASNDKIAGDEQNYTEAQAKRGLQTVESVHGRAGTWAPVAGGS